MIASLRGTLRQVRGQTAVVEVGGVGYLVHISGAALAQLSRPGQQVELHTRLCVRENDLSLYGFASSDELDTFSSLLTVSGVGPRLALAVLSVLEPPALRRAVAQRDASALQRVPGIGAKTAQRLLMDLQDRLSAGPEGEQPAAGDTEVIGALTALGYTQAEAERAAVALPADAASLDQRILAALRSLAR